MANKQTQTFGEQLKQYRKKSGLTQEQLAHLFTQLSGLDCTPQTISNWERDARRIDSADRATLVGLITALYQNQGIKSITEANNLLFVGGYRNLSDNETAQIEPNWAIVPIGQTGDEIVITIPKTMADVHPERQTALLDVLAAMFKVPRELLRITYILVPVALGIFLIVARPAIITQFTTPTPIPGLKTLTPTTTATIMQTPTTQPSTPTATQTSAPLTNNGSRIIISPILTSTSTLTAPTSLPPTPPPINTTTPSATPITTTPTQPSPSPTTKATEVASTTTPPPTQTPNAETRVSSIDPPTALPQPTSSQTPTQTPTSTQTATATATATPTNTPCPSPTFTPTPRFTATPTHTPTPTRGLTIRLTTTPTPVITPTILLNTTAVFTPTPTPTPTLAPCGPINIIAATPTINATPTKTDSRSTPIPTLTPLDPSSKGDASLPTILPAPSSSETFTINRVETAVHIDSGPFTANIPANTFTVPTNVTLALRPPADLTPYDEIYLFTFDITDANDNKKVTRLQKPVTLQISYDEAALTTNSEANLRLYQFNTNLNQWTAVSDTTLNTKTNTLTTQQQAFSSPNTIYALVTTSPSTPTPASTNWIPPLLALLLVLILTGLLIRHQRQTSQHH